MRKSAKIFFVLSTTLAMLMATPQAIAVETKADSLMKLCGAGRVIDVSASAEAVIKKWFTKGIAEGEFRIEDLAASMDLIKESQHKKEAYKMYNECLISMAPAVL